MYIPFDQMPAESRIWIYQSSRQLSGQEVSLLEKGLRELCDKWAAHGWPLHASFRVTDNLFVILAVNESMTGASGCSIDSSVHALRVIQEQLGVDFFDRSRVAFATSEGVKQYPLTELKSLFQNQILSASSVAFNNLVSTKGEWERSWKTSVADSWLSRYLPKSTVPG